MMTTGYNETRPIRIGLGLAALAALVLMLLPSSAFAQSDPDTGSVEKPYIMLLMDTSASMEWTDEGDEEYPNNDDREDGTHEWKSGKPIFPPGDQNRYGPCYIWEPSCNNYHRPAWAPEEDEWSEAYEDDDEMKERLESMRENTTHRLQNSSQPRHVTLKEILTGEMIMLSDDNRDAAPDDQDPDKYPPGCWMVPRQRDASSQRENVCKNDGNGKFEELPDFDEPRPHFQEVFDGQREGLMDTLGRDAVFALAMFDGYKNSDEEPEKDWDDDNNAKQLNDPLKKGFAGLREGIAKSDENDPDKEKDFNYNLGVFSLVSPTNLDMSDGFASDVSDFVQTALVDAGFVSESKPQMKPKDDEGAGAFEDSDNESEGGVGSLEFSDRLDKYLDDYTLGRQPVARATPLAAAMYDIHHFFAEGPKGEKPEKSPVVTDPYKRCRPKHVVMVTDGHPEPELTEDSNGDPVGEPVGGDTLSSAYGYDRERYPYSYTEDAIEKFVLDHPYDDGSRPSPGSDDSYLADAWNSDTGVRFNPRVHVVGLKNGEPYDGENEEFEQEVVNKTAAMAVTGKSCAGAYLGEEWLPEENGDGDCDLEERFCLDPRQPDFMADNFNELDGGYRYEKTDGTTVGCKYPALLLTTQADQTSDPDSMANPVRATNTALQLLFNNILSSGVSSRTRPTFVNRLDDTAGERGGQYRYFSGMSIDQAELFWQGLLYRETQLCSQGDDDEGMEVGTDGDDPLAFHDQIDEQSADSPDEDDSRRIFTSFARGDSYSYDTDDPGAKRLRDSDFRFRFGMNLVETDDDEFEGSYLTEETRGLDGSRVTFEYDTLEDAIGELNSGVGVDDDEEVDLHSYFQVNSEEDDEGERELRKLIDEIRGRSDNKEGRAFGPIDNSSPTAVEPPSLDLPIDSYRQYRTLFEDRPSMLYVSTLDGMLHGIHAGELDDSDRRQVRLRDGGDGSMHEQREAWAYIPQILHGDFASFRKKPPKLMDGTPTVQDVRLCHQNSDYNHNRQACSYDCDEGECESVAQQQWRTVLLNGLGDVGAGYVALDVTRPGGEFTDPDGDEDIQAPDPAVLWEFDPNWERGQVESYASMGEDGQELVWPESEDLREGDSDDDDGILNLGDDDDDFIDDCGDEYEGGEDGDEDEDEDEDEGHGYFWNQPFLGASVGEAAIGTVRLDAEFDADGEHILRRPIAVFGGGAEDEFGPKCDRGERSGRAIYVVDLQTGTLLRRFVSFDTQDGEELRFPTQVSGTPALYDNTPGSLTTRGFVGDGAGRLFRLDLTDEDPAEWSVELFFNPYDDDTADDLNIDDDDTLAPADYKPAITKGTSATNGDVLVYYGLGSKGELGAVQNTGMMIGLRERIDADDNDGPPEAELIWNVNFENDDDHDNSEALTGAPVIFNRGVFFTTFVEPGDDLCQPGWSRIYGMYFEGGTDDGGRELTNEPMGLFLEDGDDADVVDVPTSPIPDGSDAYDGLNNDHDTAFAYQPEDAGNNEEDMIVRGLTITTGPSCSMSPDSKTGGTSTGSQGNQPTLMAQSSASGMDGKEVSTGDDNALYAMEHGLSPSQSQQIPLSWSVIDN